MKRFLIFCLIISFPLSARADVFFLNAGEELVGTLNKIASDSVVFTEASGEQKQLPQNEISHILLSKIRPGDEINSVASLTDPFLLDILKKAPDSAEFPDSDFVTLYRGRTFTFTNDHSIVHDQRLIVKVLKEGGMDLANQSLYFHPDRETQELIFAHTYALDGHIYHVTDDAISEEAIFSSTPEYDNLKKIKFALKKASIGSILDISLHSVTQKSDALHPYFIDTVFGEREPVLREDLVVTYPQDFPMSIEKFNWQAAGDMIVSESTENTADGKTWKWTFTDRKGLIPEQNMAPLSRLFPRVTITPTKTWDELAASFAQGLASSAPSVARMEEFLKETNVASAGTSLEKATVLYDAILRSIRILGISFSETGEWQPIPCDVTLAKKYGNNIARVSLLYHLLKHLGIESSIGLSSSWVVNGFNPRILTLGQSGDVCLRIMTDGSPTYAYCGSDYLPFGNLPAWYQGSPGAFLVGNRFVFEKLPEGGSEKNRIDRQVRAKLEPSGDLIVDEIRVARGIFEDTLRVLRASKDRDIENFAQRSVKKVHPKAELLHFALSNLSDMQSPAVYTLSYRIPQAAIKASDRLLAFKNFWVHYDSSMGSLATRTFPMIFSPTEETTHSIVIELPEHFRWVPWNRNFNHVCSCLSYVSGMRQLGRLLVFSDVFKVMNKFYDPQITYPHFRTCVTRMTDLANQWIILEKVEDAP